MEKGSLLNLILATFMLVGFWTAVYFAVKKWANKRNAAVGETMWRVIMIIVALSAVGKACDRRRDDMSVSHFQQESGPQRK